MSTTDIASNLDRSGDAAIFRSEGDWLRYKMVIIYFFGRKLVLNVVFLLFAIYDNYFGGKNLLNFVYTSSRSDSI